MKIQSTKRNPKVPLPQETGLLIGFEKPPPELAEAAQIALDLPQRPTGLLVGVAANSVKFTPMEQALIDTGISGLQMVSTELAKSSGIPTVQHGIRALWLGVKAKKLYDKWSSGDKNVAALIVETTATGLGALGWGVGAANDFSGQALQSNLDNLISGLGTQTTEFFNDKALQTDLELMFTGLGAAASGEDVSMALTNRQVGATEMGKALKLVSPIFGAAISTDPAFEGVRFKPLPQYSGPVTSSAQVWLDNAKNEEEGDDLAD